MRSSSWKTAASSNAVPTPNWWRATVPTRVSSVRSSAINAPAAVRSRVERLWYGRARPLWLAPFSFLYGAIMALRSLLYRLGLRHRVKVGVPVVVVGNLTVGGTGKTPLVAWLSNKLSAVGLRVA